MVRWGELQLEESLARRHEPLREPQVVEGVGRDPRDPVGISLNGDDLA